MNVFDDDDDGAVVIFFVLVMFMHIFGKSDQNMVVIVSNKTRLTEQQSRRVASHLWRMKRHLKLKDLLFTTGYTTNVRTQLLGANTKSSEHRSNKSESESESICIRSQFGATPMPSYYHSYP